jgi:hypothetical protein
MRVVILKLHGNENVTISLINNYIEQYYAAYNFRVSLRWINIFFPLQFFLSYYIIAMKDIFQTDKFPNIGVFHFNVT